MLIKHITLVSLLARVAAAGNKWAWKNVAEPQCNNCKCYYKAPQMDLKPLKALFTQKLYMLMASKLRLQQIHIAFGNRGMIKTDQQLAAFAPFTFKTYFSRNMKKASGNWTLGETVTGSYVLRILGNVLNNQYETGTSLKINSIEDSLMGDGLYVFHALWADEANILYVSCFGSQGYSGWYLLSTRRTLSRKTQKIVLDKKSVLGFNPKRPVVCHIETYLKLEDRK